MTNENSFCFDDSFTVDDVDCHVSKLKIYGFLANLSLNNDFVIADRTLQDCFSSCSNQQLDEKVFSVILPIARRSLCQLLDTIEETLNNLEHVESSEDLKQSLLMCQQLLNLWEKMIEHISGNHDLPATQVKSLLETSPEILKLIFQHCKTSSEAYGILFDCVSAEVANLFHKANAILKRFLTTLDGVIAFDKDSQVESELLVNVIDIIGSIVTIANGMDVKTHVEVSRAFGKLAIKHQETIKHVSTGSIIPHIEQLAKDLCLILSTFKNCDNQIEERTIKAAGLLLKIFEKLFITYSSFINTKSLTAVFELLLHIDRCLPSCLKASKFDEKTIDLVNRHFPLGSETFLNIAFKHADFKQIYFEYNHRKNIDALGYHLLTLGIMNNLASMPYEHYNQWVCGAESILDIAFTSINNIQEHILLGELRLPGAHNVGERIRQASIYEVTLVSICSLIIHVPLEQFHVIELLLLKHLLASRFWSSMMSMDAWCFVDRLGSSELCASHLQYLMKVYANLSARRNSLETVMLETLIGRLYTLLSDETKHSLIMELKDYETDFWIHLSQFSPIKTQMFLEKRLTLTKNEMPESLEELQKQPKMQNWNRLRTLLSLARVTSSAEDNIIKVILSLWDSIGNTIEDVQGRDLNLLSDFIIVLLNAVQLKKLQNNINATIKIFKIILICCAYFLPFVKVAILHYLQESVRELDKCPSNVIELLANMICELLEDLNPWVHQEALETFDNISHTCPNVDLVTSIAECIATNEKSSISDTVPAYLLHTLHYQIHNYQSVPEYLHEAVRCNDSEHICAQHEETRRKEKHPKTEVELTEEELLEQFGRLVTNINRLSRVKGFLSRNTIQRLHSDAKKLQEIVESAE